MLLEIRFTHTFSVLVLFLEVLRTGLQTCVLAAGLEMTAGSSQASCGAEQKHAF